MTTECETIESFPHISESCDEAWRKRQYLSKLCPIFKAGLGGEDEKTNVSAFLKENLSFALVRIPNFLWHCPLFTERLAFVCCCQTITMSNIEKFFLYFSLTRSQINFSCWLSSFRIRDGNDRALIKKMRRTEEGEERLAIFERSLNGTS